jgi:Kdo2-lipid IVA lauroyltransferase/acyltransferase
MLAALMESRTSRRGSRDLLAPRYWATWMTLGCMRVAAWLPLPLIVVLGSAVGTTAAWLAGKRRRIAEVNLRIAFPGCGAAEIRRLSRASIRNFIIGMLEIGLAWWSPRRVLAMTDVQGLEHLDSVRSRGLGAMLLTAHFTCIEIGLPVLAARTTLQAMYKRPHNAVMDWFMERHRSEFTAVIADNDSPISLVRGLSKGHAMWYAPDQDFRGKDTLFVPLFGVEATALTAPARIASMAQVPVIPALLRRKPWGRGYVLTLLPPLRDFPRGDEYEDALTVNRAIEDLIRQNPEQYLWVHKRYKRRRDGARELYPA